MKKELAHGSFLPENFIKKGVRFAAKKVIPLSATTSLIFASCGGEKNNTQELKNNESLGYELPFPKGETWYLTTGPHGDGYSNGIKYAIDIAPPEGGFCPPDGRKFTIDNRVVTASASGEVIIKGDDKNRDDPHHSEIRIENKNGLTQAYTHLDNTKVKLGDKVRQGDPLGNPSCEFPPGGRNTGPHVHVGLMKDGQAIPIDGAVVGGWTIHERVNGQEGTMTKDGEKTRTADVGRYGENSTGIRNDLPNNSNKVVVAGPKDPISPISGSIKEKTINPTSSVEKPVEKGLTRFVGNGFQLDYPSDWKTESEDVGPLLAQLNKQMFESITVFGKGDWQFGIKILSGPLKKDSNLDSLKNDILKELEGFSFTEIPNRTLGGQKAWAINIPVLTSDGHLRVHEIHYLIVKDQRVWLAELSLKEDETYDANIKTLNSVLSSFQFTNSAETKKSAPTVEKQAIEKGEKKISISKTPEDLYHTLASTPLKKDLPSGMSVIGNPTAISSSEISSNIGKMFGATPQPFSGGTIFIQIDDERSNPVKGQGYPNVSLTLIVFTSNQDAQDTYNKSATQNEQTRPIPKFPYAAVIEGPINGMYSGTAHIKNVVVGFTVRGNDMKVVEQRTIDLMQSMPKLLQNAGN